MHPLKCVCIAYAVRLYHIIDLSEFLVNVLTFCFDVN